MLLSPISAHLHLPQVPWNRSVALRLKHTLELQTPQLCLTPVRWEARPGKWHLIIRGLTSSLLSEEKAANKKSSARQNKNCVSFLVPCECCNMSCVRGGLAREAGVETKEPEPKQSLPLALRCGMKWPTGCRGNSNLLNKD